MAIAMVSAVGDRRRRLPQVPRVVVERERAQHILQTAGNPKDESGGKSGAEQQQPEAEVQQPP